jgi:hypothetical protein
MSYEEELPRRRARSGAVTAVAIINFIFGALALACGCFAIVGGGALSAFAGNPEFQKQFEQAAQQAAQKQGQPLDPQAKQLLEQPGKAGGLVMIIGGVAVAIGVAIIIAGIGVIQRRSWGRILTLVLGVLWILVNLYPFNFVNLILPVIYCIVVFVILLNSKYAAEFA